MLNNKTIPIRARSRISQRRIRYRFLMDVKRIDSSLLLVSVFGMHDSGRWTRCQLDVGRMHRRAV